MQNNQETCVYVCVKYVDNKNINKKNIRLQVN